MDDKNLFSVYSIIPFKNGFLKYTGARKAYQYFQDYRINLLSGKKEPKGLSELLCELKKNKQTDHFFFHAFYEFGYFFRDNKKHLGKNCLGILIEYDKVEKLENLNEFKNEAPLAIDWKNITLKDYKKSFDIGYKHLQRGDCYQYNLTFRFTGKIKGNAYSFAQKLWAKPEDRGAYGHFTYSTYLKKGFLSNSPECLFQISQDKIQSMPIKGSIACEPNEIKMKAKILSKSDKNESELFMITDLLRNDLNILSHLGAEVIKKKSFLKVPRLLHTFSLISTDYKKQSLYEILKCMFPGGSITGAPKKRVMEIIQDIETVPRGFYCGSSIIKSNNIYASSINIRSAVIDEKSKTILYGAGGGITFDSKCEDEFSEMILKRDSFSSLVKN